MISKVVVTGAGGQTGGLVFRKMLAKPDLFNPIGVTRSEESRKALLEDTGASQSKLLLRTSQMIPPVHQARLWLQR